MTELLDKIGVLLVTLMLAVPALLVPLLIVIDSFKYGVTP